VSDLKRWAEEMSTPLKSFFEGATSLDELRAAAKIRIQKTASSKSIGTAGRGHVLTLDKTAGRGHVLTLDNASGDCTWQRGRAPAH
jgi:hypothetical protein